MAQITQTVAQGILDGQGYTDNEVRQLAHFWLSARAPADSVTAPAGPGWQLVPTDPTNEMLDAARRACEGRMYPQDMRHGPRAMMADRYNAMLAAAPTPSAQADSVLEDASSQAAIDNPYPSMTARHEAFEQGVLKTLAAFRAKHAARKQGGAT